MIRDEALEFGKALADATIRATDDTDNGDEVGALLTDAFRVIQEGADFKDIPQSERLEAVMLGVTHYANLVAAKKIVFSDEGGE